MVYIVLKGTLGDSSQVEGVFSTVEKAKAYVEKNKPKLWKYSGYEIQGFDIDEEEV